MSQIDPSQSIITGSTRLYAIIGDPIQQVGSPRVFNPILARNKVDAVLVPIRIAPADLATAVAGLKAIGDLDLAKAERLAWVVGGGFPAVTVSVGPPAAEGQNPKGYDLVVNCSPMGMRAQDPPPVDLGALDASMTVVDIVLLPEPTPLLA